MSRHVVGAGAAACAICCAAPLLGVLGIAGAAATVATFLFAGAVFALVVGVLTLTATLVRRRRTRRVPCDPAPEATRGPVHVELTATPHNVIRTEA